MPELERELLALPAAVDFPTTPDIASRIHERLPGRPRPASRRRFALAVAVVAVAVGAAFAVPQARTAILRFFGVGEVRIEFVDRLPEVPPNGPLALGAAIDPADAPFPLLRSKLLGKADGVYNSQGVVTLLYGSHRHVRLLVTEIAGTPFDPTVGKKLQAAGTHALFVSIRDSTGPGVWIEGRPHLVVLPGGPPRLAADTLIWQHGKITVRLEGATSLQQAVTIAESLH
jgi:hypothetical protein